MSAVDLLLLAATLAALAALPSTSAGYVVVTTLDRGRRGGFMAALGIVGADLVFVALALAGLTAAAEMLGGLFFLLRLAGGAYLVWLGINLIRRARSPQPLPAPTSRRSGTGAFLGGFLLTLGDLKAILFYGSLLPVFFDLRDPGVWQVTGIVGATLISVGGVKLAYALLAHRLQSRFGKRSLGRRGQTVAGCLLVGAGSWVIVRP